MVRLKKRPNRPNHALLLAVEELNKVRAFRGLIDDVVVFNCLKNVDEGSAVAFLKNMSIGINLDSNFTVDAWYFALAHELSHIDLRHQGRSNRRDEYKADRRAVKVYRASVTGFEDIIRNYKEDYYENGFMFTDDLNDTHPCLFNRFGALGLKLDNYFDEEANVWLDLDFYKK